MPAVSIKTTAPMGLNSIVFSTGSVVGPTTTDPVEKTMEFKPIGAVVFIDTAGIDDSGALGKLRVAKTRKVVERTELAVLVADSWTDYETEFISRFRERK